MRTYLDCIPCFIRQSLDAVRVVTDEFAVHEALLRDVLRLTSEMDLSQSPPCIGQQIHRRLRELTGNKDPYAEIKKRFNSMALEMLPQLRSRITAADDSFAAAVRLAITGNIIDFGPKSNVTEKDALNAIETALSDPLYGDMTDFREMVEKASSILYIGDNAGEIMFDRLLIEQLLPKRVTFAVRGAPVINDATYEDAEQAGLTALVEVIDSGSDAPGTILEDCSEEFLRHFHSATLIIAKGQGNFETLSEAEGNIVFLFKAKCPVIAAHAETPLGAQVLLRSHKGQPSS